jgi:hypothetical protein
MFINLILFYSSTGGYAQTDDFSKTTRYRVEAFGSAATGNYTPFWMVSNRRGVVPLDAGNGYLKAGVFHEGSFANGFRWNAGLDLVVASPRYRQVFVQQLYAGIDYKAFRLSVGSKERHASLWDERLSSGDMVLSSNARPIPEVNLSMPEYTVVPLTKGWLHLRGDFAIGRSFDSDYLKHVVDEKQTYIKHVLWHHKSLYFRIKDTRTAFPLSFELGVRHWVQWGGTSTDATMGVQPHCFTDFLRVLIGREGGSDAALIDITNALGNHYGSYDFKLTLSQNDWALQAYHQHFFDDKSGMVFNNKADGLWGVQLALLRFRWMHKIVVEYVDTRDQTGPMHFILFDHEERPGLGGGDDDYYNNEEYTTGVSYFDRGIGSPLIPSPEYNTDGVPGFRNNRVRDWHLGIDGCLSRQVTYRALFTLMNTWGRAKHPFLNRKDGVSGLLEIGYRHPRLSGWSFTGSVAADSGNLFGKGIGVGLTVSRQGVF